ncbi:MAG: HAD-IIB family hydrolase [Lachnospiraceae bacterium]|nr:HAD-IIB family hydrolase [Lachnospiraceae bacterium]
MKAIITDLDRTLLYSDKSLSEYAIDVLKRCRAKGLLIMAATARPERSIWKYDELIHFDAIATINGAKVLMENQSMENGIAHTSAEAILARLCGIEDIVLSLEASDGFYANVDIPEWSPIVFSGFPKLPTQGCVYKILASCERKDILPLVQEALTEDTYYTVANGNLIQIMSKGATKWKGIQTMLAAWRVSTEEAVYFGDDNDDIEAIQKCGLGVAVANAIPAVLEAADVVVGNNDEDGVARYLEEQLLR